MPKANDGGKPGDNATQTKGGKSTDDATGKKAGTVDNSDDDDDRDELGSDDKPKGKFYTDDEFNSIIQRRVARATKEKDDEAKLSKEQLLEKERDEARNELRTANARDSFIAATGLDYSKASRLFRVYANDLEFDDKGKPENMKDVIKTARSEFPEFFGDEGRQRKKGDADLGGGNGDGKKTAGGMNAAIRNAAGRS